MNIINNKLKYPFLLLILIATLVFQIIRHFEDYDQIFNIIKSYQFFYGVLIIYIGSICAIRIFNIDDYENFINYIVTFLLIAISVITISELFITHYLIANENFLLYKNIYVPFDDAVTIKTKPIGVALYAQPNSIYIAYLLIYYILLNKKLNYIVALGLSGLIASMGGTGFLIFISFFLITKKIKNILFFLMIFPLVYLVLRPFQMYSDKINVDYWIYLINNFINYFKDVFSNFNYIDFIRGTPSFGSGYHPGFTHDWSFIDIIYEGGLIGLTLYLLIYLLTVKTSLSFIKDKTLLWIYAVFIVIVSNFHYSALNFYFGQMFFGITAAIIFCSKRASVNYGSENVV